MGVLESFLVAGGLAATKAAASSMVKKAGSKFTQELLEPALKRRKAKAELITAAKRYIVRLDKATKSISTVAISGPALLDDIYVPLTLTNKSQSTAFKLDQFPATLFAQSRCVLLTDTAGMGKSTATRFITQATLVALRVIPIWVELRKVVDSQSLQQHIAAEIFNSASNEEVELLREILEAGDVLVLLDGYDEIDTSLRTRLNSEINDLSIRYEKCWFLVASRPDSELKGLSHFREYNIQPLKISEAFDLIRKYDPKNSVAERLISKVKSNSQIKEFLRNPLLVSLLFKAFDYKATIPLKRHIFFRQVFDALYQDHDLSKGAAFERKKKTGLDIEDFHKAVRAIGIASYFSGRVQYGPEEFQGLLESARQICAPLTFDPSKMRADLLSSVPLFTKDGTDIRWSHKAFQDYFAAQYIYFDAQKGRDELVRGLIDPENPRKNENILQILIDLDRELVERLVLAPLVEELFGAHKICVAGGRAIGFEAFQCMLAGGLFFLPRARAETLFARDKGDGLHKFLTEIDAFVGGGTNNPLRMATSADAGEHAACVILVNRFSDKLHLIASLMGQEKLAERPYKGIDKVGDVCSFVDAGYENVWDLVADGRVSEAQVREIFECTHGLAPLDKSVAERILQSARIDRPYGTDWLEAVVRSAKVGTR